MACHFLGIDDAASLRRSAFLGSLFEGLVASESVKAQINRGKRREIYYSRDQQGLEVDFIVPSGLGSSRPRHRRPFAQKWQGQSCVFAHLPLTARWIASWSVPAPAQPDIPAWGKGCAESASRLSPARYSGCEHTGQSRARINGLTRFLGKPREYPRTGFWGVPRFSWERVPSDGVLTGF